MSITKPMTARQMKELSSLLTGAIPSNLSSELARKWINDRKNLERTVRKILLNRKENLEVMEINWSTVYQLLGMQGKYESAVTNLNLAQSTTLWTMPVLDAWCFIEWLHQKQRLKQEESEYFKSFFTHEGWLKNIDLCSFIMCDPKVAIARNKKDASLTKKTGVRTNPKTVAELHSAFMKGYDHFKNQSAPVMLVDTTDMDMNQATRKVLIQVLEEFERKFD